MLQPHLWVLARNFDRYKFNFSVLISPIKMKISLTESFEKANSRWWAKFVKLELWNAGPVIRPAFYACTAFNWILRQRKPEWHWILSIVLLFLCSIDFALRNKKTKFLHFQWPFYHFQLNFYYKHAWLSKRSSCIIQHLIRILMKVHHLKFEWKFHWRVCSMRNVFHQCEFSRTIGKSFQLHR